MNHKQMCDLAVRWLKRPASAGGHGCQIAVAEVRSGWVGEIPDAVGFRSVSSATYGDGSVLVEVKTSRSDFLRDRFKPHRAADSLGNWRYYMCPEGLIQPEELPEGWGLLWVNKRGSIKAIAGAASEFGQSFVANRLALVRWKMDSSLEKEQFILVHLLSRLGDVERLNKKYKDCEARARRAGRASDSLREQLRKAGHQPCC